MMNNSLNEALNELKSEVIAGHNSVDLIEEIAEDHGIHPNLLKRFWSERYSSDEACRKVAEVTKPKTHEEMLDEALDRAEKRFSNLNRQPALSYPVIVVKGEKFSVVGRNGGRGRYGISHNDYKMHIIR